MVTIALARDQLEGLVPEIRAFRAAYGRPPGQFRADLQRARFTGADPAGDRPQLAAWLCELY